MRWKIVGVIGVFAWGCASAPAETGPKLTPEEARDSAKVWHSIGKDYLYNKQNYERAIKNFWRALGYDSTFTDVYVDLGRAYLESGKIDSAEWAYRKIAEIDPKDTRGWQGLGFMYGIVKHDVEKAREFYMKALEVDPENNDARFGLAKVYEKAGMREKADSIYQEALAKDPDNPALNRAYGLFLFERGDYEGAVKYLEKAYEEIKDDKELHEKLLDSYRKLGGRKRLQKALEHANWLIQEEDSTNYAYYLKRGEVYEGLKKYKEAEADYLKAMELADSNAGVWMKAASFYLDRGKTGKAQKLIKEALEFPSGQRPEIQSPGYAMLGDIALKQAEALYKKRKYKRALSFYDTAISYYRKAVAAGESRWAEYARKKLEYAQKKRKKAWRKYKQIE